MCQYWATVNLTLGEGGRMEGYDFNRLEGGPMWKEFFFHPQTWLVRSLTIPFPSEEVDSWLEGFSNTTPSDNKSILRFPNEVLLAIVEYLDGILEKVCFALTCKRLLSLSRDHIEKLKRQRAAPWAGCRIICVGDYTDFEDLPKALLTTEEAAAIREMRTHRDCFGGLIRMLGHSTTLFWGNLGLDDEDGDDDGDTDEDTDEDQDEGQDEDEDEDEDENEEETEDEDEDDDDDEDEDVDKAAIEVVARLSAHDRARFLELHGLHYPARDDWAVCNLTTAQYVLARDVAACGRHPNDAAPFLRKSSPDLSHVVLYRMSWSSDTQLGGADMEFHVYEGELTRGDWAGHEFVITTLDRLPDAPSGKGWTDISERVCRDLKTIWTEAGV